MQILPLHIIHEGQKIMKFAKFFQKLALTGNLENPNFISKNENIDYFDCRLCI